MLWILEYQVILYDDGFTHCLSLKERYDAYMNRRNAGASVALYQSPNCWSIGRAIDRALRV